MSCLSLGMTKRPCSLLYKVVLFTYLSDGFSFHHRHAITALFDWQAYKGTGNVAGWGGTPDEKGFGFFDFVWRYSKSTAFPRRFGPCLSLFSFRERWVTSICVMRMVRLLAPFRVE
jgi:hypothetical protein